MRSGVVACATLVAALSAPIGAARASGPCDPDTPSTCTTRELATQAGLRFGATLEPSEAVDPQYSSTLAANFNALTPENAMKLYTIRPSSATSWNWGPADAVVDFATTHDMEVRGHTLVWAQDQFTPAWVRAITDPAELQQVVDDEITTVMNRYRGRVHRYDVVNEPLQSLGTGHSDSVFWTLGDDWVANAFRLAHQTDPTAELWLNETTTEWFPGKHDALVSFLRTMLDDGVPITGVGVQTHLMGPDIDRDEYERQLRDFADLGLRVAVTELDVPVPPDDPAAFADQTRAYRTVVDACIAVDGCDEVTTWGLTDASTWLDSFGLFPTPTRPLLFDDAYQPKPAYVAVRDSLAAAATASTVSVSSTRVVEGDRGARSAVFTVALSEPATSDVTLEYRVVPLTARLGTEIADDGAWHAITIATGATTRTIPVRLLPDTTPDPDRVFAVELAHPTGGFRLREAVGAGIVLDDDRISNPPRIDVGDAWVVEGDAGSQLSAVTITLSTPSALPTTLSVRIGPDQRSVVVPAMRTSVAVRVPVAADTVVGPDRRIVLRVVAAPSRWRIARAIGTLTVVDDD